MKKATVLLLAVTCLLLACQRQASAPAHEQPAASGASVASAPAAEGATPQDLEARAIQRRATEAAIWGMSAVNADRMRQVMLTKTQGKVNQMLFWSHPADAKNQTLTPNPDAIYFLPFFDTKDVGPIVIELPPADGGSIAGSVMNIWQMPLEDVGLHGVDQGKGGKYVVLPPGYKGVTPAGYIVLPSDTYTGYALLRSNLKSHAEDDIAKSIAYGKRIRVYPLSQAANPPATVISDASNVMFDSGIPYDHTYFDSLNRIVQAEPWLERDRAMIDPLRTLGIEKGKPYSPDARTRQLMDAAMQEVHALLASRYDAGYPPYFDGTHWTLPTPAELIPAMQGAYGDVDQYPIDARALAYTYAFVGIKHLGTTQFYLINIKDKDGKPYDGNANYRLHVPANAPVEQYWSVTVYDRELHTVQDVPRASVASGNKDLQKNEDGSVDVYFGPKAPAGKEGNWVPTDPKRRFELMFRFYGPTKALFDKAWKLPDVESE